MELQNLRRFGGAQRSDQVRQRKRFADKTFIYLEIKLFIISSGKYRAQECLFFLKETKMQITDDLVFLWGEILHLESHGFQQALKVYFLWLLFYVNFKCYLYSPTVA